VRTEVPKRGSQLTWEEPSCHRTASRFRLIAGFATGARPFGSVPASVGATTPGQNGLIAFRRIVDDQARPRYFTVNPDGGHERQITFPSAATLTRLGNCHRDGTKLVLDRHMECGPDCGTGRAVQS